MKKSMFSRFMQAVVLVGATLAVSACSESEQTKITTLNQLEAPLFGVPTGTVADQLVLSRFPDARFQYFNSVLDSALAVKTGKVALAAYDEPILRNIAAKNPGLKVLPEMITQDHYGFAVRLEDAELKQAVDAVIADMKASGDYSRMMERWLPEQGAPAAMPQLETGRDGVLRFGTSAVTEPFSFIDGSQQVVGIDIELASRVAKRLNKRLEVVNMDFGAMIPALSAGKVDMIGACITITDERAKKVLFSEPYYTGGIAALVRE